MPGSSNANHVKYKALWFSRRSAFDLSKTSDVEFVFANALNDDVDAIILPTNEFESLSDCHRVFLRCSLPVILIVEAEQLEQVLTWLRECDDVCLANSPRPLIETRIRHAVGRQKQLTDALTGTYRRDHLMDHLETICENATVEQPVCLTMFDADHFKTINDTHGHTVGDQIVVLLAKRLKAKYEGQFVARYGGGEFAVATQMREDRTVGMAEMFRREIETCGPTELPEFTVSAGVAVITSPISRFELIKMADEALYAAKAQGRNCVVSYGEMQNASRQQGDDVDVYALENKARVMTERVTNFITQRSKKILRKLRDEADTDGLTSLYTRRYFDRQLPLDHQRALENSKPLSIALVDVDHFGLVNKNYGWPTGDKALSDVCSIIQQNLRSTDWVGRYGGEEICLVMPGTKLETAITIAERIRAAVEAFQFETTEGRPFNVTLSAGVIEFDPEIDSDSKQMIERVSLNTLAAKNEGRNRLVFS